MNALAMPSNNVTTQRTLPSPAMTRVSTWFWSVASSPNSLPGLDPGHQCATASQPTDFGGGGCHHSHHWDHCTRHSRAEGLAHEPLHAIVSEVTMKWVQQICHKMSRPFWTKIGLVKAATTCHHWLFLERPTEIRYLLASCDTVVD
jgi:hypothetical protein